ncbi:hypothetical protein Vadar_028426 [Vaccinium darrowii]|uniref:Uncharacterized protein n=1 Tax=Vaccinium darrowii TaxID=229202 RepID=A0ACB7YSC0_9ERIC|nr:hypothetical protein Vadar_028426 [Vaccinium darrowii]
MRIRLIRKRYPPPPQSDSTPLHHRTPHLLQPSDISPPEKNPQPSDLSIAAASGTNGVDSLDQTKNTRCTRGGSNQDPMLGDGEEEADEEEKPLVSTNWRLDYSYTSAGGSPPSASPSHKGHWCEEDKLFPLKKRRASFTNNLRPRTVTDKEQRESVTKTTRNREKIWVQHSDSENEEELEGDAASEKNESKKRDSGGGGGKKPKKPMANWRCHRNSGSGRWRCNRPTIPGHSLCEHHLSQARVRDREKIRVEHCDSEIEEELEDDAVGEKYEAKKRDGGGGGKKPVADQRCHRNSGSGWRCSRPTILGLSLCEHHLSQSRVKNRNYARIRNQRNGPKKNINNVKKVYTSLYLEAEEEEEEWDDVDDKGFEKRGVMKARSINSLLSQTVPKYTTIKGNALTV